MKLHQKKTVKKARRKIEEKRRILAEGKDNEENNVGELKWTEKENELGKSPDERVKSKAKVEAAVLQALKEVKKKAKKERQAEKKRLLQQQKLEDEEREKVIEKTIPAMVTIKRVTGGGNNSPTVEITLKVSTPEDHKLMYTLLNGSDNCNKTEVIHKPNKGYKKKKKAKSFIERLKESEKIPQVITKELKVTVVLDMMNKQQNNKPSSTEPNKLSNTKRIVESKKGIKINDRKQSLSHEDLLVPNILIPPGITITRISSSDRRKQNVSSINDMRPMVTVAETEKLIHMGQGNKSPKREHVDENSKSKTRKNNKTNKILQGIQSSTIPSKKDEPISLIPENNMISDPSKSKFQQKDDKNAESCDLATIFTNENGTITVIRNCRLKQPSSNSERTVSIPLRTILNQTKSSEVQKSPISTISTNYKMQDSTSHPQVQKILSGLPEIQISKVDMKKPKLKENVCYSTNQMPIIPTSKNGREELNFD
ncbi:uncharacterized protein [Diabrotica undecimpunctata]|uniref:uncharacterized protein n=1 Tax=Diabrotica undecimpunctata TaxID=50387 RepID=UPI003B631ED3